MDAIQFAGAVAEALATRLERHYHVEPTLTLEQAARELGLSIDLVRQLCKDGEIPHVRVGKFYRIKPIDINNYLERNYHKGATK